LAFFAWLRAASTLSSGYRPIFQPAKPAIDRASILEKKSFESRRRNPNAETLQFGIPQELMGGSRLRTFHDPIR